MALEDDMRSIRTRRSQALAKQSRAQAEYDIAQARFAEAKKTLKDEFGVENMDDGKVKLLELKATLDKIAAEIDAELTKAGA